MSGLCREISTAKTCLMKIQNFQEVFFFNFFFLVLNRFGDRTISVGCIEFRTECFSELSTGGGGERKPRTDVRLFIFLFRSRVITTSAGPRVNSVVGSFDHHARPPSVRLSYRRRFPVVVAVSGHRVRVRPKAGAGRNARPVAVGPADKSASVHHRHAAVAWRRRPSTAARLRRRRR